MKQKILSFIFSEGKFLALYSKPHPEHGSGGWFVLTGSVEKNETREQAVRREIKEETNLDVLELSFLNWGSIYNWGMDACEEQNFFSLVKHGKIILNEEHSEFKWLELDEFIKLIKWDDDKKILKKVLKNAIKKKKFFKELNIIDYRKK